MASPSRRRGRRRTGGPGAQARSRRPGSPTRRRRGPAVWAVLVVAAVTGFLVVALLTRLQTTDEVAPPDPDVLAREEPAALPPPSGLELPTLGAGEPVAEPLPPSRADPAAVAAVVEPLAARRALGRRVHVTVADLDGTPVASVGTGPFLPASLTKLLTGTAATAALDPGTRFATSAELLPGTGARPLLHLVGGGDPLLASSPSEAPGDLPVADLGALARESARNLAAAGTTTVRLRYDDERFSGDGRNDAWPETYYDGVTAPITALMVDQGREGDFGRVEDPSSAAAEAYASLLEAEGITVRGRPRPASTPVGVDATETVGVVRSAPLELLVRHMLENSDNTVAEVLAHQLAVERGRTPDFTGAARATEGVLRSLGVPLEGLVLRDASGLSRSNRIDPATLVGVLHEATSAERPELRPVVTGLPVAGFSGSLATRYTETRPEGLGTVRAKTGTLSGVHGLAGVVVDRDGTGMLLVAVADRVPSRRSLDARDLLATLSAELAACRCAATTGTDAATGTGIDDGTGTDDGTATGTG